MVGLDVIIRCAVIPATNRNLNYVQLNKYLRNVVTKYKFDGLIYERR